MRTDIQDVIQRFGIKTFGNQKNIERIETNLQDDEIVLYFTPTNAVISDAHTGKKEKLPGIFLVSNRRVLFYFRAALTEKLEVFDLSEIKSIDCSGNGLTGGHINIHTIVKTLDIMVTYKKESMQEIRETIENAIRVYKSNGNTPQPPRDEFEQIEKLHGLLERGIISQEEFDIKKRQLLGL